MVHPRSIRLVGITLLLLVAVPSTGVVAARQSGVHGPLDGMAFVGETGRDGNGEGRSDKFVFAHGKFRASSFSTYGFSDARYEIDEVDGELTFTVSAVSNRSSGGKLEWTGTLRGDVLEGTMRWDHGWESKRYWFRGRTEAQKTASR